MSEVSPYAVVGSNLLTSNLLTSNPVDTPSLFKFTENLTLSRSEGLTFTVNDTDKSQAGTLSVRIPESSINLGSNGTPQSKSHYTYCIQLSLLSNIEFYSVSVNGREPQILVPSVTPGSTRDIVLTDYNGGDVVLDMIYYSNKVKVGSYISISKIEMYGAKRVNAQEYLDVALANILSKVEQVDETHVRSISTMGSSVESVESSVESKLLEISEITEDVSRKATEVIDSMNQASVNSVEHLSILATNLELDINDTIPSLRSELDNYHRVLDELQDSQLISTNRYMTEDGSIYYTYPTEVVPKYKSFTLIRGSRKDEDYSSWSLTEEWINTAVIGTQVWKLESGEIVEEDPGSGRNIYTGTRYRNDNSTIQWSMTKESMDITLQEITNSIPQ